MKKIILAICFLCAVNTAKSQELVRTGGETAYQLNPIDSSFVVDIIETIEINFIRDNIIVKYITANENYGADTTYNYIERSRDSRILSNILLNPTFATYIEGLKSTALNFRTTNNNNNNAWGNNTWVTDSIRYQIIR